MNGLKIMSVGGAVPNTNKGKGGNFLCLVYEKVPSRYLLNKRKACHLHIANDDCLDAPLLARVAKFEQMQYSYLRLEKGCV